METGLSGPPKDVAPPAPRRVGIGRISGVFGVRGWVRVFSYTDPREKILDYSPWRVVRADGERAMAVRSGHAHGAGVVASLEGVDSREAAAELMGCELSVDRAALSRPPPGQYYWADLEGLDVIAASGAPLGQVVRLFATGANDVMEVRGERRYLLPFVTGQVILSVDLPARRITVDWDPEWATD